MSSRPTGATSPASPAPRSNASSAPRRPTSTSPTSSGTRAWTRSTEDVLARWGGEEFAVATLDALIEHADRHLYAAKRDGRNRASLPHDGRPAFTTRIAPGTSEP